MKTGAAGKRTVEEISSLAERMGYMQALRVGFALVVLAFAVAVPETIGASLSDVIFVSAIYLLLSATIEGFRRSAGRRGIAVVEGMLLVDAVYLALVNYTTGGTQSPLRFLIYLHLIGVTLLTSYRTGVKIAVWHGLLFLGTFYAQASELLPAIDDASTTGNLPRPSAVNVVALLLVAVATMTFSSLNERELKRRKNDLEALNETARGLEDVSDPRDVARILLEGLDDALGFRRGVVLAGPAGEDLLLLCYRGPGQPADLVGRRLDAVIQKAFTVRAPQLLKKLDPHPDPRLAAMLPFAANLIVVPLFAEGRPLGVLAVEYGGRSTKLERRVFSMVGQFALHAALALRNAWLLQEVRRMADTDALTGIANRRTFERVLERELSRAMRHGEQVTLVMLDLDRFKSLNDTHGHQAGDETLRLTAQALRESCRDFDTPARYGGEEFSVVLPACSPRESLVAAERLRQSICEADMPIAITASAGVATFPVHASDSEGLIRAADEALYESKRAGRNRITRSRRQAAPSTASTA